MGEEALAGLFICHADHAMLTSRPVQVPAREESVIAWGSRRWVFSHCYIGRYFALFIVITIILIVIVAVCCAAVALLY